MIYLVQFEPVAIGLKFGDALIDICKCINQIFVTLSAIRN